ncbi:cyclase family protein [Corynebacterium halotolerans]|uniref:Cyclase family protein n=1 Tax=Corynebacterium halotolerans YIM 70093 = DSM 44683 TaxID=1121362 RepID=M1NWN8_9CORY|nr:cyclase family protein [Corynebacterium halotolerans]AGF71905.1 hypothetical protein A605_04480 [Corynebacterium halotolerans YIM 70093 = DSM 44683]
MSADLWEVVSRLSHARFTDLTHHFRPGQPKFAADPDARVTRLADAATDGFTVDHYCLAGPWGTHVDAPSHADPHGRTLDDIPVRDSLLPLVVIDLATDASADPDLVVTRGHLAAWEERHGAIPAGSFVALRTGWSARWAGGDMHNLDAGGIQHTPGWGVDALALLHARGVTAIGHETLDADPGARVSAGEFPAQRWWLDHDHWQIEALTNLDRVPATGALLIAAWPAPVAGAAFPARAIAVVER